MAFDWIQVGTDDCPVHQASRIITKSSEFHKMLKKWTSFARELEVEELDIQQLRLSMLTETNQLSDVVRKVIDLWVGKSASQATLAKLLSALESSGLKLTADALRREFQPVNSDLDVLTYYVNRTIITRNRLNKAKLKKEIKTSEDHFIFSGIALSTLNYIMENESIENSTNLLDGNVISQKCIVLDRRTHYDKLCEIANRPVHLINCHEDKWIHIKSSGNLSFIQRLTDRSQTHWEEDKFFNEIQWKLSNHPICIADSPGMGKTTLLHSFAKKLRETYPERAIWFVTVNKFVNIFKQNGGDRDASKTKSAFESTCIQLFCPKSTQKPSLAPKLNSKKLEIELMLDGLDEVVSSNVELAFEVLKFLLKYSSIRIWVTTRPHLQNQLENVLNVFGYNLQPFNETDQITFLRKFWTSKCENLDYPRLEKFTKNCLSELKTKLNKKDQDIAGIPLQCLLIGEVYEDQALEHSALEDPNESGIIRIASLTELYEKLIYKQREKYMEHYGARLSRYEVDLHHKILSIQLIFPDIVKILPPPFNVDVCLDELLKVGLLEKSSTLLEPRFIHRTIGEYFISLFISQKLQTDRKDKYQKVLKQLLSNVLLNCKEIQLDLTSSIMSCSTKSFYFLNTEICYFLNILIGDAFLNYDFATSWENMLKAVHACVYGDYFNIFKILDSSANEFIRRILYNEQFLFLTVRYSSVEFVRIIFDEMLELELDEGTKIHLLFLAVKSGHVSTCQYLINKQNLRELLEPQQDYIPEAKLVLHECVKNTENDSGNHVQQKIKILRLISEINKNLLEQKDLAYRTPVLCESIHPDLLTELVSFRKVDIMVKDINQNTILHRHYIHSDILFEFISPESLKILIQQKNSDKVTPLMTLIENVDPTVDTLSKFKHHKASFNCKTSKGHSLLAVGIVNGRNSKTIRNLIDYGASLRWKKGFKRKSLVHYAGQYGNVDVMHCLADQFRMSLCSRDWSRKCAVDYLVKSFKERGHNINFDQFISIIESAPKVQIEFDDETKETVLVNSVAVMNVAAVEYLLSDGIQFLERKDINNNQDWDGKRNVMVNLVKNFKTEPGSKILNTLVNKEVINERKDVFWVRMEIQTTLLHLAVQHGNLESVEYLIDYGHDLNVQDEDGTMPLELFDWAETNAMEKAKHLVTKGADLSVLEKHFLLHSEAAKGNVEKLEYFLELGLNINAIDANGRSPLSLCFDDLQKARGRRKAEYLVVKGADVSFLDKEYFFHTAAKIKRISHEEGLRTLGLRIDSIEDEQVRADTPVGSPTIKYIPKSKLYLRRRANYPEFAKYLWLHNAVQDKDVEQMEFLLNLGLNVNALDDFGRTPLHMIIHGISNQQDKNIIDFLINKGASIQAQDMYGRNVLHIAAEVGNLQIFKYFLQKGVKRLDLNAQDFEGKTPLHFLMKCNKENQVWSITQLMCNHGADLFVLDENHVSLLHEAASKQKPELVQYLLEKGLDPNGLDMIWGAPLHYAVNRGWSDTESAKQVIQILLGQGAKKNIRNNEGFTPLEMARKFPRLIGLQSLLK